MLFTIWESNSKNLPGLINNVLKIYHRGFLKIFLCGWIPLKPQRTHHFII